MLVFEKVFKVFFLFSLLLLCAQPGYGADKFTVLCYHDIPEVASAPEDIPRHIFVKHLEYLRTNGFTFVGPQDVREARQGLKALPEKAVLLTFDDAYLSFYKFVYPLLKIYNAPAVLSVVTSWIG
ncbi:MAG: polysaccharide deacetylase family protein, partial [Deltaproteobacteria bacterium]|nr:polysaccharide deacetylase family protein [Deltaproteobacteria bacterium]